MLTCYILTFGLISSIVFFTLKRTLNYLHMLQQQEYNIKDFCCWLITHGAIDKRLSITLLGFWGCYKLGLHNLIDSVPIHWCLKYLVIFIIVFIFALLEQNPLVQAKKKLNLTKRATRIYYTALLLNFSSNLYLLSYLTLRNNLISLILAIQLIPGYIVIANFILAPLESWIQRKILTQAKQKLSQLNPIIIGITGSYGKTSVKHFLGHILAQSAHTLITSGSINTTMGIARTIKEELSANYKYFIVEMGAYYLGSIDKICQLTPPDLGIITAIGAAHYSKFNNLETTAAAKFELAQAVIKKYNHNGSVSKSRQVMTIPEQVLNTTYAKTYLNQNYNYFMILQPQAINKVKQTTQGLAWDLKINEINYPMKAPIFGVHNVTNLSLAAIAAHHLGIPIATIITALQTMPQIKHRLEVRKSGDFTIIDDGYNANPDGFKSALELLSFLHEDLGRRILITPGIIELGEQHVTVHFSLGVFAAKHVDVAIIVKPQRIKSFVDGFKQNAASTQQLIYVDSFKSAQAWLKVNVKPKDLVLIANDLPDLYETGLKI